VGWGLSISIQVLSEGKTEGGGQVGDGTESENAPGKTAMFGEVAVAAVGGERRSAFARLLPK
jgi:hypothetical protein